MLFFKKSVAKILAQSDPWDVFFDLWERLDTKRPYEDFSAAEKVIWCVYRLRAESEGGSLDAYVSNSSGDFYDDTIKSLALLNASEAVGILQDFNALLAGKMSAGREERNAAIEMAYASDRTFEGKLIDLTRRLGDMWPDIISKAVDYLRANADQLK